MKYRDENGNWQDIYLKPSGDTLPIGTVVDFAGDTAPYGWLICDGSLLAISSYPELYNVIGTSFTLPTDMKGYFRLPNKKGRVSVGLDKSDTDFDNINKTGGSKYLQEHSHTIIFKKSGDPAYYQGYPSMTGPGELNPDPAVLSSPVDSQGNGIVTGNSGNLQPYIVLNSIIKVKQSVGIVGKVANEENEEEDVVYSAKYIEENFVRIT